MKHANKHSGIFAGFLFVFILVVSTIYTTKLNAAGIEPVLLKYQLKVGGTNVGFINTDIKNEDNGKMTSTSTTEVAAAWKMLGLAPNVTEKIWFQAANGKYRPTKYFEKRTGKKAYESNITIDWSKNKLNFAGGDSMPIPQNALLELGSIPLSMMMRPASDFSGQIIKVIKKKGVREFKVGTPTPVKIETAMGPIHTIKIPAHRLDKPTRKLAVWLAPDHGNIPVMIEEVRKKRTTTLSLVAVNGEKLLAGAETTGKTLASQ